MAPRRTVPPAQTLTLKINDVDVTALPGQTILETAREYDIEIPALCYVEGLSVWGGCRLCLVEVEGTNRLLAACATECSDGMVIKTNTERLQHYRQMITEMLFSERNHICSVCVSNGHCELQSMAQNLEVDHVRLPYRFPALEMDNTHEMFRMDHNRCIMCTRCVRVCDEIEGAHTKDVMGRGIDSFIITDLNQPWGESSTCTSCGKCVHVCPTGALSQHTASTAEMVKERDFLPYLTQMRGRDR